MRPVAMRPVAMRPVAMRPVAMRPDIRARALDVQPALKACSAVRDPPLGSGLCAARQHDAAAGIAFTGCIVVTLALLCIVGCCRHHSNANAERWTGCNCAGQQKDGKQCRHTASTVWWCLLYRITRVAMSLIGTRRLHQATRCTCGWSCTRGDGA